MLTVIRPVYYCEFCKRHRITRSSIVNHEPRCIYNPNRTECGWHADRKAVGHAGTLAAGLAENLELEWLLVGADRCPACMLAVVVQANLTTGQREDLGFDYKAEVERFRREENDASRADVW